MAERDERTRLSDEVRDSAEREAMGIVAAARRDIRQIVLEARRELFVLSAQVQAALGEGPPGPPRTAPQAAGHDDDRGTGDDDLTAFAQGWGIAPHSTVAAVLEEARADMAGLARDARDVPSRPVPREDEPERARERAPTPALVPEPDASTGATQPLARGSLAAGGSSTRRFVAVFGMVAAALVIASLWMLRGGRAESTAPSPAEAAVAPSSPAPAPPAGNSSSTAASRTSVSVTIRAVRPSWIRAVVDGRPDAGQTLRAGETYELTGRTIVLRVGDAGAVLVSVNGGEAVPLGRDGQVVNREYALDPPAPDVGSPPAVDSSSPPEAQAGASVTTVVDAQEALPLPSAPAPVFSPGVAPPPVAATSGVNTAVAPLPTTDPATSTTTASPESWLVAVAEQWLDAYHRQDRAALAALSAPALVVADERPIGERIPPAAGAIARTIDRVSVQVAADTAVLTGVMTERAVDGGLERSAPISLVWVSSAGTWRLSQARLVSQSTLGRIFR